ncbi:hypothetical protein [Rhizobium sp. SL42]|nr:hypothetical protein [Rhizobium sp. SL42]
MAIPVSLPSLSPTMRVRAAIDRFEVEIGALDILVNNAGMTISL